jgi:O-antigen ligase
MYIKADPTTRSAVAERWALALFGIAGAVFLPEALNRFVFPKLVVVALALLLAMAAPARGRLPRAALVVLALAGVLLLAAALASTAPLRALLGRPPRDEGVLVLPLYLGAAVAGARLLGPARTQHSTAWFLDWLSVAALAIGALALMEATGLRPLSSDVARPGSLLGNASDEGAWAVLALGPLAIAALRSREPLHIAGAVAAAAALVCSGSRGALLGAVVAVGVLALLAGQHTLRLGVLAIAVAVAVGAFALPATRARVLGTASLARHTATGRELLWGETLSLLDSKPLLGVGPSGYLNAVPRFHDRHYALQVGAQNPPDSPHNWILQAAAAGGVPLAALAVALAALTFLLAGRRLRGARTDDRWPLIAGMVAGLAGYATALLFFFTTPGSTPLAALMAGALLATAPVPARRPVARIVIRRLVAVVLALLVIVLSSAALAEIPLRSATLAAAAGRITAANSDFGIAAAMRPWDSEVPTSAAAAFAALATDGVRGAAALGASWSARARSADPESIAALAIAATVDLARAHPAQAAPLLAHALRLDPTNAGLYIQAAAAASALHEPGAVADLHAAERFTAR